MNILQAFISVAVLASLSWGGSLQDVPIQRFDGWYNNPLNPSWGGVGRPLERNITPSYKDETYQPSGWDRPNPRRISNVLFGKTAAKYRMPNKKNLSALFAFFGLIVGRDILHTGEVSCPVEVIDVPVPRGDPDFDPNSKGDKVMPYERSSYEKNSGQSPNNPRRPMNWGSSVIDGSFLYGKSSVRAEFLRDIHSGKMASEDKWGKFPLRNDVGLPFNPYSSKFKKSKDLWRLGDTEAYENPAVLALSLLFYRYHNSVADQFKKDNPVLSRDEMFEKARRWVIGSIQKVIMYDWLPKLIGKELPPYTGYKQWVKSDVTDLFDAGALNYIMTLIPPAILQLEKKNCEKRAIHRLCTTYWKSMDILYSHETGMLEIIKGLALQQAESSDTFVVDDYRNNFFGPIYHSNHDAVLQAIMKGRDYGLPDYNTVRAAMGLEKFDTFDEVNLWLRINNSELMDDFKTVHNGNISSVDMFVGGMMETTPDGPGELFTNILYDQFIRLRDGDRFWFENNTTGLFTDEEIKKLHNISLGTIFNQVGNQEGFSVQEDPFITSNQNGCSKQFFLESDLDKCPKNHGHDFFEGSEIPYIIIWTCLGLLPLLCILTAYILAKCKKWRHERRLRALKSEKEKRRNLRRSLSCSVSVHDGLEWRGPNQPSRSVELHLTTKGCLEVFATTGTHLRSIKICNMTSVGLKVSSNAKRNVVAIVLPREYDLVVEFRSEAMRNDFVNLLCEFAQGHDVKVTVTEHRLNDVYSTATTKEKRNRMLEKFFKKVFSEAYQMDYDPSLDREQDMKKHNKEILEIELSKEEFAEAMAVKPNSDFVEHFFSLIDSDRNGYISFREFLNAVVLFSKGSIHDKLLTMFYMYDVDGTGFMSMKQIGQMFRSLLELAQSNPTHNDVELLVHSLCQQSGMEPKEEYSVNDFCQLLSPQLSNVSFEWKGIANAMPPKLKSPKRTSTSSSSETEMRRRGSSSSLSAMDGGKSSGTRKFEAVREHYTPVKAKIKVVKHFIENYRHHIFFIILFFGIVLGLFAERFYYYTVEQEDAGFRKLMSYGISMTRGAAAAQSFTFSFLLLTMCRNTITYLRSTPLNLFIPFDSHISFHKVVAWTALFFSAIHIIGYSFNFYHLATQPTRYLCVFKSLIFRTEDQMTFQDWVFGTMTGFTGVLLVLVLCILYVFATQTARRHIFSMFWMTHKLFIILYVLCIIHGASVVVQKPLFFAYLTGPAIWFTVDKLVSLSRKKTELCIIKAQNLASDVTMIEFKRPPRFEYKSGQWVRIACLAQGKDEYHPFTLTSAPHEDTLKLHIRALGPWTWNLRHIFDNENMNAKSYPKLYLDGPYGAGQQDWYQYDVSVLVGAGIGVTPYASILKDFVHMSSIKMRYKVKCQKLYFIWITGSQRHFEWLIDILREVEEVDTQRMVSIDIFITQFFQNFDLRTALLYIFEEHFQKLNGGKSVFTGLKATTHFGRPQLNKIMGAVHRAHPQVRKVGVFSCGPPGVTKGVERACVDASKTTKAMFEHHFENF